MRVSHVIMGQPVETQHLDISVNAEIITSDGDVKLISPDQVLSCFNMVTNWIHLFQCPGNAADYGIGTA